MVWVERSKQNKMDLAIFLGIMIIILWIWVINLRKTLKEKESDKQRQSNRYGTITENFFPFTDRYPYDPKQFRFLGNPVDGVQFNEDKIIFIEFKYNKAGLTQKQKSIKNLIHSKKIFFETYQFQ